jgi:hypothetical protein
MLSNNPRIKSLINESGIEMLAKMKGITLQEAGTEISQMSFKQFLGLLEAGANITPPSGQTIGTTGTSGTTASPTSNPRAAQTSPAKASVMWAGQGQPIEQGMTVGLKGPNGVPVPGEISQVDQSANGVRVRNPTTGQDEWHNNDELEPYVGGSTVPGATNQAAGLQQSQVAEDIARLRKLAGISEDASCGATGAGAIAIAPTAMGNTKKRQAVEESPPRKEYTPKGPAKTIVGDTKPGQASGELSANLAVRGKKTASRINNGIKR